jgi:hypothetical protein
MTSFSARSIDDRDRSAHFVVIPANAGIQFARHSRESGNPVSFSQDFLGSARCRERATFVLAKVAKTIAPA